jgi:clan AA aspartic protease
MGHVHVDAELAATGEERVRLLVDTGATYALVPEDLADRLGLVRSPRSVRVTLADGGERALPFGTLLVRLEGREAAATVLIGPAGAEPLLGVEALEALGLRVDPATGRLEPTRARAVLAVGVRSHAGA